MYLNLEIKNFSSFDHNNQPISVSILQSGVYTVNADVKTASLLFLALSGQTLNFKGDILLNGISVKNDRDAAALIQKSTIFIEDIVLLNNFTVEENIRNFSLLWSGQDLSDFTLKYFALLNLRDVFAYELNLSKKSLLNLTKLLSCPCSIWLINRRVLKSLSEDDELIFQNLIDYRVKQGGIVVLVKELD